MIGAVAVLWVEATHQSIDNLYRPRIAEMHRSVWKAGHGIEVLVLFLTLVLRRRLRMTKSVWLAVAVAIATLAWSWIPILLIAAVKGF